MPWFRSLRTYFGQAPKPVNCWFSRPGVRLAVERLEARELPVVGANALAPVVNPGTGYDGVVRISTATGFGSGSLLQQGGGDYVLTAAHVLNGTPADVRFDMPLGNQMNPIPITINVPAAVTARTLAESLNDLLSFRASAFLLPSRLNCYRLE